MKPKDIKNKPIVSIIVPTFNEEKSSFFKKIISAYVGMPQVELIISDGGSADKTLELCNVKSIKLIKGQTSSRAERLKLGVKEALGNIILLHHPRSMIEKKGVPFLINEYEKLNWGGFSHNFDLNHPLLRFTSWYSNNIRPKIGGIVYLDHCIFLKKEMVEVFDNLPDVDIFEDTLISKRLYERFGKPQILPFVSKTSSVRFINNGIFNQALNNQILKLKFYMGVDHKKMNKQYENKISLNTDYD